MSGLHLVILALVVMAALAFWNWQRSGGQKAALEQSGFTVTERLGGSPELVIDSTRQELALVRPDGYDRYAFRDYRSAELGFDERAEANFNYRIELDLGAAHPLRVSYGSEWDAERALEQLRSLIK